MKRRAMLVVFLLLALASGLASTPAAWAETPTPTTQAETPMPTETPTPVLLPPKTGPQPEDLPPHLALIDPNVLGMDLTGGKFVPEEVFVYMSLELLMGLTVPIDEKLEQLGVDTLLDNPDMLLEAFTAGIAGAGEEQELPGLDDIGDASKGVTVVANMGNLPARIDAVVFRQGANLSLVFNLYYKEQTPLVSIKDLALKFSERLSAAPEAPELVAEDLPAAFAQLKPAMFGLDKPSGDFKPEHPFAFMSMELVMGATVKAEEADEEEVAGQILEGGGVQEVTGPKDVGERARWFSGTLPGGMPFKADMAVFRRGSIVAMAAYMYYQAQEASLSIEDVARSFDARIQGKTPVR